MLIKIYGKSLELSPGSFHIFKEVLSILIFFPLSLLWKALHNKESIAFLARAQVKRRLRNDGTNWGMAIPDMDINTLIRK